MSAVNERIIGIRKTLKMTQSEFGETIGLSRSSIGNIEYGLVKPAESIIRLICQTHRVNYDWLKDGVGEMFAPSTVTDEERFDEIMSGKDEFTKSVLRCILYMDEEQIAALRLVVDALKKLEN